MCDKKGNPSFDCCALFNAGVERPCFDSCYRLFLMKIIGEN